jgi:hypothetical protein
MNDQDFKKYIAHITEGLTLALDGYHSQRLTETSKEKVKALAEPIITSFVQSHIEFIKTKEITSQEVGKYISQTLSSAAHRAKITVMDKFGEDHTYSFLDCYLQSYLASHW